MHKEITSTHNSFIKEIVQLQSKSRVRKNTGHFVIEGKREISLALKGNYKILQVLYCDEIYGGNSIDNYQSEITRLPARQVKISKEVYQKIAQRDSTEGIMAIAESKNFNLSSLQLRNKNPLILVAEAPEKPGNIGALLRTADAANVDAVLIANPITDMYNPNIIRSSVGCVFTNQIATGTTKEIIQFLESNSISIFCAALTASKSYETVDYTNPSAIVVGTEATGLSDEWLQKSTQNIIIPMQGQIDSLNVSVSAAILIFEAKRQRKFL
ncbi:RNA methyltransferase [Aureibaculum sp. 2210JD6-5]|uniref:TrmH family RNA methyltransferase n=1 Tax=Aureibaculum sp. 2210JD6-5 TaxID=3103957 RepID=UPI002AACF4C6|nr:RNA methyltransferase [Aureibaculum sp. 2210JD6-5]MDY7394242.1 RNA methyltransferase [Aureibaculum sp. 2210JD6-5]